MEFSTIQKGMTDVNQWFCGLIGQVAKNKSGEAANPVSGLNMGKAKTASAGLGKLESSKGKTEGPKIQTREDAEKANKFEVEKAKLKEQQLGESKKLYDSQEDKKADFKSQQDWELAHFEATHKGDKDIVSKRMKFIDMQAAARGKFQASLTKENIALYKKHKGEEAALNAKYQPKAAPIKITPKAAPVTATKSTKIVQIAPQYCGPELDCKPLPAHDGLKDELVYVADLGPKKA